MSKNVKKVKKVTFSEECFTSKECPEERPHCIKTTTGEEGRNIVGNCGKGYLDDKWQKEAYSTNEKPYNYGGYYIDKGLDPGKFGEYDIEGNLISSFINPHYKPKRKRRDEWWKGGKKKKRTRKRRRKKRRRTRKKRRKKRRRTRK